MNENRWSIFQFCRDLPQLRFVVYSEKSKKITLVTRAQHKTHAHTLRHSLDFSVKSWIAIDLSNATDNFKLKSSSNGSSSSKLRLRYNILFWLSAECVRVHWKTSERITVEARTSILNLEFPTTTQCSQLKTLLFTYTRSLARYDTAKLYRNRIKKTTTKTATKEETSKSLKAIHALDDSGYSNMYFPFLSHTLSLSRSLIHFLPNRMKSWMLLTKMWENRKLFCR